MTVPSIRCPDCHGKGEPCSECGGDGKFHSEEQPDYLDSAVGALLDNSDAEPIGVLTEFLRGATPAPLKDFSRRIANWMCSIRARTFTPENVAEAIGVSNAQKAFRSRGVGERNRSSS